MTTVSDARLDELIDAEETHERTLYYMQQGSVAHAATCDRLTALRELRALRAPASGDARLTDEQWMQLGYALANSKLKCRDILPIAEKLKVLREAADCIESLKEKAP